MNLLRQLKRKLWRPVVPCWIAAVFVIGVLAASSDDPTGLTCLLRFGDQFANQRIPEIAGLPVRSYAGAGYDGQFYAQLAVNPDVRQPAVQAALDNPRYRARRILMPAIIHALGGNSPWQILNLCALANLAAWLVLGWRLWVLLAEAGWQGTGVWLACMLGIGALDSVRLALTDLPAMLLIFLATEAAARNWKRMALVALAASVLTRDTSLFATVLPGAGSLRLARNWWRHTGEIALIALPLGLWSAWITWYVPAGLTLGTGHFSPPGFSLLRHLLKCGHELTAGNLDSRYVFGLLAGVSFTWQAVYVLHLTNDNPVRWLRIGLPCALLYFVLGGSVWQGYWAVARTCLPLTFAFNLLLVHRPHFWWHLALGNLCVLHAVYRVLPD